MLYLLLLESSQAHDRTGQDRPEFRTLKRFLLKGARSHLIGQ